MWLTIVYIIGWLYCLEYIEEQLAPMGGIFGEQICHMSWVDATPNVKKPTFNKRIFVVGRFRILVVKKGTFGKSVCYFIFLITLCFFESCFSQEILF